MQMSTEVLRDLIINNKRIHIHGIAYANFDRKGNYTVDLTVNEHENHRWGRENFQGDVHEQSSFKTGIRMERKIAFEVANLDLDTIGWTASSTLEIEKPNENVLHRDYDEKKIRDLIENLDWEDEEDHELPKFGLSPTDPDSPRTRGQTHVLSCHRRGVSLGIFLCESTLGRDRFTGHQ